MPNKDDKFRRVVADPKETAVNVHSENSSDGQIVNAETGEVVDQAGEEELKVSGSSKTDGNSIDVTLTGGDAQDEGANVGLKASVKTDAASDVDLSADRESVANDIAMKAGAKKANAEGSDISFSGKGDTENTNIGFSGSETSRYETELVKQAENLNAELQQMAEKAKEAAEQVEQTMQEVELKAKKSKLPERLATRLAGVKAKTDAIKTSTDKLRELRDGLKDGK